MPAEVFGREAELRTVAAFLDGLQAAPGALVIGGEAGVGKTTLLRAGVTLAAGRGLTVLRTMPARSDMRLAFVGLADLLQPCLSLVGELPPPQARALRVALLLEEPPPNPPDPHAIAAAFRAAATRLSRAAPVLFVIDDVQWLDPASQAALGFALRRLEDEPIGLLCAQLTDGSGADPPLELARARFRAEVLPVGGLGAGALHRLLRTHLGTSFSHQTLLRIEAQSGGNPFIALEIAMALVRRGGVSAPNSALPLPQSITKLVAERLSSLGPDVLAALAPVAVMPSAPADVQLAAGADSAALDKAVLAGVLEPDTSIPRFTHPLLAAAVADGIAPGRKRELHAVAARIVRRPEERARHAALGSSGPSAAVAADLDLAAAAAASRGAPATAAELCGLAAGLTPDDRPADARRRRLEMARQLAVAGETRAASAELARLIAAAPPGPERSDALTELGKLRQDDFGAAEELFVQALAEAGDDPERRARISTALSHLCLMRGDPALALIQAQHALRDAEAVGSPALLATVLARNFDLGLMCGEVPDEGLLERALQLERLVSVPQSETPPSLLAGMWHLHQGRLDVAEKELGHVLARAEAEGVEYWRAEALLRLSQVAARRGELTRAAGFAAECLDVAEQLERPHMTCAALHGRAAAAVLLGNVSEARQLAAQGADLARETGDTPFELIHAALLGSLDLALGEYAAAAARLSSLLPGLHVLGVRPLTQAIWADTVEALVAAGKPAAAGAVAAALERSVKEPVSAALAARCRGIVAGSLGDAETALAELSAALALHDRIAEMPAERGRTMIALGVVQRRLKQRRAARATLTEAVGIFERIEAPLWAARAGAELDRISGRGPASAELTATERRVADLVARGLSNREAAAELFVSVRAVESTLTRMYAKLGVRSRSELAARLRSG